MLIKEGLAYINICFLTLVKHFTNMMRLNLLKSLLALLLISGSFSACKKDNTQLIGYEISGTSSCDGIYLEDKAYTKGIRFIHKENDNFVLKSYTTDGVEMWGLLIYNESLIYKTPKTGDTPPESGWTCGVGVDKPKFKVTPVYE